MTDINKSIFREYDIRGIVGSDLTEENVEVLGKALGTYFKGKEEGTVVVGRDNRLSSESYATALNKGLKSTGMTVIDIGLVVTPMCYYAAKMKEAAGVMITASHNPKEYNGFKIQTSTDSVCGDELQKVYEIMVSGEYAEGEGMIELWDVVPEYYAMLKDKITLERPLKVVIDCGNGTASLFAQDILEAWGCEVVSQYCESDGNFPHHTPDPVKVENAKILAEKVREENADLGIGFDGDGDRLGVVDEKGTMIYGDVLMVLFYDEILKDNEGMTCLIEVKCSEALYKECEKRGGVPEFSRTGHSLIKARMKETGSRFAGEMSGHMFFADEYYGFDDAFYAAGRLLRILAGSGGTFSELLSDVPAYVSTPEVRVKTTDDDKFTIVSDVQDYFKNDYDVVDVDGARINFPFGGWGLVRASNTQPVLVVRAEAKNEEDLEKIKSILEEKLTTYESIDHIDWTGSEE
ncbi:phosphomannomutase/phosphoglucomutase [Patescibacteria group bacterium]|nr:phosphomannomutase/phosphoglucomutase [Patescibacteria group bacterium]